MRISKLAEMFRENLVRILTSQELEIHSKLLQNEIKHMYAHFDNFKKYIEMNMYYFKAIVYHRVIMKR